MGKSFPVLGFDVGATKVAVCLGKSDGTIIGKGRVDNNDRHPDEVLPEMVALGKKLIAEAGMTHEDVVAIGIGSPAPHDIPNGLITTPTNMKKWVNVPIRDYLKDHFNIETYMENDANAGALAEWFFGAGKKSRNMLYLTMSTGIGGGLILNGHLLQGKSFLAGEAGHICIDMDGPQCNCGMKGCYEAFCGGRAIANRLKKQLADQPASAIVKHAGGVDNIDMIAVEKAVRDGDEFACKLWDDMMKRNAQAIGLFVNLLNPEMIVLGTLAWAAEDLFMPKLMEYLPDYCWAVQLADCKIIPSGLKRNIGEYAGLSVALNALFEQGRFQRWED